MTIRVGYTRGWLYITSVTTTMDEDYEDDYEDGSMRMTRMSVEDDYPRMETRG
jgi:hypothetical protein